MKIALAQTDIQWENKEKNKEKCLELLISARQDDVRLILFPEMTLTGFSMNVQDIYEESIEESSTIQWFLAKAMELHISIGFGWVSKSLGDKAKNNYTLVSPQGILCSYTKIHPFSYGREGQFYTGGNTLSITAIENFNVCPFICYDLRFPEIFQAASHKAELITVAANWPKARRDHWLTLLRARAIENQCFVAGINRTGIGDNIEYSGDSIVIDPYGNILAQADEKEQLLIQKIDLNSVYKLRSDFKLKADRRESLYCCFYKMDNL